MTVYKQLNKFKEDTNKELSEIWKTMQDMKGEFNKDIESFKNWKLWKQKSPKVI
jgi:hypothetical protein